MPYTRSFEDFSPPRRFDGQPFTIARIQESAGSGGPWATIASIPLDPLDADPANPLSREFTTDGATLESGWYRIEWVDASDAVFDSAPVYFPTPAGAADALVSLAEARDYLQTDSGDLPADPWLELAINGVSSEIASYTGRAYVKAQPDEPDARPYPYVPELDWLAIDDCREITKVETSFAPTDDASWSELSGAGYVAEPLALEVKSRIRFLRSLITPGFPASQFIAVRVTAKWGWDAVPEHVKLAALMWIEAIFRRDAAYFSADVAAPSSIPQMPADVRQILDGEKRPLPQVLTLPIGTLTSGYYQ